MITCPVCHRTSHHPEDVRQGYCGFCHWWTSDPTLAHARVELAERGEIPALFGVAYETTRDVVPGSPADGPRERVQQILRQPW